ncbi:uncharacterized protein LOC129231832 [Uloborus diversus]|uniref:uncharacterized protein LOC129231832 n=1 Tax=Uloborus diversus TaxID=327109 RepID=UPI00240904B5|nr:uncharacterized protein LOC129231832 [Uloborus diversus]
MMDRGCSLLIILLSFLGLLAGVGTFVYFLFGANNINASIFALISGVIALAALHIHLLYYIRRLYDWYSPKELKGIVIFGLIIFILSAAVFGAYIALAIEKEQTYVLEGWSYYPAATCAAHTLLWSFVLFISALVFRKRMLQYPPLLEDDKTNRRYS